MKTMTIILGLCHHCCNHVNWQPVIESIPCICWGILLLFFIYFILRYVASPLISNCNEQKIKKVNYEQEVFWHFQTKLEKDYKKELNDKIKELEDDLKKEKDNREKTLKEERLQAEHDFYKKIVEDFYTKKEEH